MKELFRIRKSKGYILIIRVRIGIKKRRPTSTIIRILEIIAGKRRNTLLDIRQNLFISHIIIMNDIVRKTSNTTEINKLEIIE